MVSKEKEIHEEKGRSMEPKPALKVTVSEEEATKYTGMGRGCRVQAYAKRVVSNMTSRGGEERRGEGDRAQLENTT